MDSFSSLFKKENMGQLLLVIIMAIYLIMGYETPEPIANLVDTLLGKIIILLVVIYLISNANPILAILSLFVAFDLVRRSSMTTGIDALKKYAPSEIHKMSQFSAFNQFPYTLEQEVVSKMAPIVQTGPIFTRSSFHPMVENLHDASPLNGSN